MNLSKYLILSVLLISLLTSRTAVYGQLVPTEIIDFNQTASIVSQERFGRMISRSNSISIYLNEFIFAVERQGKFICEVTFTFKAISPGTIEPKISKTYKILLKDLVELRRSGEIFNFSLNNKLIVDNVILSDYNYLTVEIKLVKIRTEKYQELLAVIDPILNVVKTLPVDIKQIENIVSVVGTEESNDLTRLLFSSDFQIPANILAFNKLELNDNNLPFISNNEIVGIVFSGNESVNRRGVAGGIVDLVGDVTRFVSGTTVIPKQNVNFNGIVKLNFTKEAIAILPTDLSSNINELTQLFDNYVNTEALSVQFNALKATITQQINVHLQNRLITNRASYTISNYLRLLEVYIKYLTEEDYKNQFRRWHNQTKNTTAGQDFYSVGLTGLFDSGYVEMFLPGALSDEVILSYMGIQKILLSELRIQNYQDLVVR